jgi:K+-transporting ATPase ATPase B chain
VVATSGRAVEAAGDVDVLLLDKTGTITLGNRQAARFVPASSVTDDELADETPESRSLLAFARERYGIIAELPADATAVPLPAQTRLSGLDLPGSGSVR